MLIGLTLIWLAEGRSRALTRHHSAYFSFDFALWAEMIALGILAGSAFGLAAQPRVIRGPYRWRPVVLLGLLPTLLLADFPFLFGLVGRGHLHVPRLLGQPTRFLEVGPQFALAVGLGLILASGFPVWGPAPGVSSIAIEREDPAEATVDAQPEASPWAPRA
jgi:hypothetical protein